MREGRGGGSTSMPHKHNPVAAICALGCAQQAPGPVATLLAAMVQEHERAAGAWHSEWRPADRPADHDRLRRRAGCAPPSKGSRSTPTACAPNLGDDTDTGAAAFLVDRALEQR